jgi:hypothetical protein
MKVYIVNGVDGDWDDRVDYSIKCFDDRKVAENYIEHLKTHNARMEKHRDYMLKIINKLDEQLPIRITPEMRFYEDSFDNFKYNLEKYCSSEINKFSWKTWEMLFDYYIRNGNTYGIPDTRYTIMDFQVENSF